MTPIKNSRIKRDFKRLLAIIADAREPDYSEVENIANRHGLYFDENGAVKETKDTVKWSEVRR
ncbi:hypothetical protein [Lederbergia citri]|uniref:Uncharacterized protein n=1 Tax=Lederbergia citri TaxID=2833580 RepID=A0A942TCG6_9BACI|nr:hypothetical protein [Lederbergia citri]MBS4195356.1 hypothetical protein [Lederbergia citri]